MKKLLQTLVLLILGPALLVQCKNNGDMVIEPKFGTYNFRTYTVDTFRFKIILNGQVLTDSLRSPVGFFSKTISFFDADGRLQVIDAKNNDQLVLDTSITMKTGTSSFSLVQLSKDIKPTIPPLPNEPAPAAGNFKVRFQYLSFPGDDIDPPKPFLYDSVKVIVNRNQTPLDTLVLRKYDLTPYYEGAGGGLSSFTVRLLHPITGAVIDPTTSPSIGTGLTGFNTVSVTGVSNNDFRATVIY